MNSCSSIHNYSTKKENRQITILLATYDKQFTFTLSTTLGNNLLPLPEYHAFHSSSQAEVRDKKFLTSKLHPQQGDNILIGRLIRHTTQRAFLSHLCPVSAELASLPHQFQQLENPRSIVMDQANQEKT